MSLEPVSVLILLLQFYMGLYIGLTIFYKHHFALKSPIAKQNIQSPMFFKNSKNTFISDRAKIKNVNFLDFFK